MRQLTDKERDAIALQATYAIERMYCIIDGADYALRDAVDAVRKSDLWAGREKRLVRAVRTADKVQKAMKWYIRDRSDSETWNAFMDTLDNFHAETKRALFFTYIAYKQALDRYREHHSHERALMAVADIYLDAAQAVRNNIVRFLNPFVRNIDSEFSIITLSGVISDFRAATRDLGKSEHNINAEKGIRDAEDNLARVLTDDDLFKTSIKK